MRESSMKTWKSRAPLGLIFFLVFLPLRAEAQGNELGALGAAAASGDSRAQFALGNRYYHGWGVTRDFGQALALYRQAARSGLAAAQDQLGSMHEYGAGVRQSYAEALGYY